jgi:hypothetical protein
MKGKEIERVEPHKRAKARWRMHVGVKKDTVEGRKEKA